MFLLDTNVISELCKLGDGKAVPRSPDAGGPPAAAWTRPMWQAVSCESRAFWAKAATPRNPSFPTVAPFERIRQARRDRQIN